MPDERLANPTERDSRWLIEALADGEVPLGRKAFVARLCRDLDSLAEVFFAPMLNAAIDEVNPSYNKSFVLPCMNAFGARRVNEYLLSVIESGTDFRKAGAINALYWANVPLTFPGDARSFDIQNATPDSREQYEALADVWTRKRRLLLETFVMNPNVDVRRSIIPRLSLDPLAYPESHRSLVIKVIEIARSHEDEYIRRRVENQLGISQSLPPLPHRKKQTPPG